MSINTFVPAIWAFPKPTIEILLYCLNEMLACDVCAPVWFTITITWITIDVNFCGFSFKRQIVRVFALFAFLTDTLFKVGTENGFRVLALLESLLLNCRDRLEQ